MPAENPAPPRPRRPLFLTSLMIHSGTLRETLPCRLVAAKLDVPVNAARGAHTKAARDDLHFIGMRDSV